MQILNVYLQPVCQSITTLKKQSKKAFLLVVGADCGVNNSYLLIRMGVLRSFGAIIKVVVTFGLF